MADQYLFDGQVDFVGGQNAASVTSRVPENAYHSGVNTSISKGVLSPRFGIDKKKILIPDSALKLPNNRHVLYETLYKSGRYQALIPYAIGRSFYLIIIISGIIYLVNQDTLEVKVIDIQDGSHLNENTPRINWTEAGRYLVIFDFPNTNVIFDGVTARRAVLTNGEIPVSTMGVYNQNRLFIANDGNEFTAGDPTGSLLAPNAPITFFEILGSPFLGQIFQLPTGTPNDKITAMGFLQTIDTSTGIGPLIIATAKTVYSYQAQNPRVDWDKGQFGSVFVSNAGIAGPKALINVNSDFFFLSADGQLRSASMSRDEQKKWARTPVSKEVSNYLKYTDKALASYAVLGYFKNKIFLTANPYRVQALTRDGRPVFDVAHGGLVVLGLDNLATLGKDGAPAWDGLWTGFRPMDICTNNERCFIMSKDEASTNTLYELDPETTYDNDSGKVRYVRSTIYTKEYDFKDPFQNKDLHSLDIGLRNVQGDFQLSVRYKPSHAGNFADWQKFSHKAPWRSCTIPSDCSVNGLLAHNFRDLTIGEASDNASDPVNNLLYNTFRRVQLKFIIEGKYWELHEYKLKARIRAQDELENLCAVFNSARLCLDCANSDWEIKPFESCKELTT